MPYRNGVGPPDRSATSPILGSQGSSDGTAVERLFFDVWSIGGSDDEGEVLDPAWWRCELVDLDGLARRVAAGPGLGVVDAPGTSKSTIERMPSSCSTTLAEVAGSAWAA